MIHWKTPLTAIALAIALGACSQVPPKQASDTALTAPVAAQVQRQTLAQGLYELAYSPRLNAVFVASSGGFGATADASKVLRLNPQTLAVEGEIPLARKGFGVALDDAAGRLYVGNTVDTSVTVVDLNANKVIGVVQLQQKTKGADGKERYTHDLRELVVDQANQRLYVTGHSGDGSVMFVVNTRTLAVEKTIEGLGRAKAPGLVLDAAGGRLFTSNLLGEVVTIDTRTLQVAKRVNTGIEQPMNLVFDPATNRIFVTDQGAANIRSYQEKSIPGFKSTNPGSRVVVLDATSGKQLAEMPADGGPIGVVLDKSRQRLFIANRSGGTVQIFDSKTYQSLQSVSLPTHPNSLALDEKNGVVYTSVKIGEKDPKGSQESIARVKY
ncbi:YncE family protein [Pigmentiphaga aceris]|uniref:YncE family protein n=1 Tax=Pigmentiphaga aceris TaxID=1940612 RepID=A0A5C0B1N1_9BURK|nr:YncE family protein [Pigmentiphaga aceris]QEI08709.1 YncE family protein [Pigmentiphaga aceris]